MFRLRRWLGGAFVCSKCGRTVHLLSFGYGTTVCPDCYDGDWPLINLDKSFILNRLLSAFWRI